MAVRCLNFEYFIKELTLFFQFFRVSFVLVDPIDIR